LSTKDQKFFAQGPKMMKKIESSNKICFPPYVSMETYYAVLTTLLERFCPKPEFLSLDLRNLFGKFIFLRKIFSSKRSSGHFEGILTTLLKIFQQKPDYFFAQSPKHFRRSPITL